MGVFRDGFNAIKGAKELGDYHGGMPSTKGSFKDIAELTDDQGQGDILKHGMPTKARVTGSRCRSTSSGWASSSTVPPGGRRPLQGRLHVPVGADEYQLSMGMEVPVKVMDDDPKAVAVRWDALKGSIAASGGDMAVAMQGIQNTYAGTTARPGAQYMADKAEAEAKGRAGGAERPHRAMKKVSQLKEAGLVSDEEFETKKAEILADLSSTARGCVA